MRRHPALQLTALFFVAFNLRVAMACIGPVLEHLRSDLGMNRAQLGLLSTLPVLCMSLFAPFAQRLSAARGHETAILFATLAIALSALVRAWANDWIMLASALVAGVGIAIAGTLLNTFVKQHFADRALNVSGLYSAALCLGAALAAGFTAPLAQFAGSWRFALSIWSIPGFIGVFLWWRMLKTQASHSTSAGQAKVALPWHSGRAWIVMIFFGLQSVMFYVVLAWLAPMYIELGWSPSRAGALLGYWMTAQVLFIFLVSRVASRTRDRRAWLVACSAAAIIAMSGFAFAPTHLVWLWIMLFGFACGGWFPLAMTLPLDYTHNPRDAGNWTAMMLFGGYLISAASPSLSGWARDGGKSYSEIFAALSVICVVILVLTLFLRPIPADSSYSQASV